MFYTHGEVTDDHTMNGPGRRVGQGRRADQGRGGPGRDRQPFARNADRQREAAVEPDFYVKTFHMDHYWSATPGRSVRNGAGTSRRPPTMPASTTTCGASTPRRRRRSWPVEKPWIAFKVMAAGAILPRPAFGFAFRNGADFVVAGMFDFQIEEDVKVALDVLHKVDQRARPGGHDYHAREPHANSLRIVGKRRRRIRYGIVRRPTRSPEGCSAACWAASEDNHGPRAGGDDRHEQSRSTHRCIP